MRARVAWVSIVVLAAVGVATVASSAEPDGPPRGFRTWKHVRSIAVTDPEHPMYGFHDGYANDAAVRGLRASPPRFEDGATFVVSIFEISEQRGVTTAGAKRRDVVQVKDRRATATGGWRFAAYDAAGKAIAVDQAACFSCHAGATATDHVLTTFRE